MMERQKETMLVILPPNEYSGKLRDLLGPLVPEGCEIGRASCRERV